ncbi:MAG: CrcB family protein [Bacteroidia bacterium]
MNTLMNLLIIGTGGFFGAIFRVLISNFMHGHFPHKPFGTLTVNLLGSFLFGIMAFGFLQFSLFSERQFMLVALGFCGSLTTMSSFAFESFEMLEHGRWITFAAYVAAQVFLCILAVWGGKVVAGMVAG